MSMLDSRMSAGESAAEEKFPSLLPEDRKAAIELIEENPVLLRDPETRYIIEHDGKRPDGKAVEGGVEDFLMSKIAWLKENPPYLSGGKRRIEDVPSSARGDDPSIW